MGSRLRKHTACPLAQECQGRRLCSSAAPPLFLDGRPHMESCGKKRPHDSATAPQAQPKRRAAARWRAPRLWVGAKRAPHVGSTARKP
eukprot:365988-Chlamydomonas_euryale.AAC.5